jgi:hypothetical protein
VPRRLPRPGFRVRRAFRSWRRVLSRRLSLLWQTTLFNRRTRFNRRTLRSLHLGGRRTRRRLRHPSLRLRGAALRLRAVLGLGSRLRLGVHHAHAAAPSRNHSGPGKCSGPWRCRNRWMALVLAGAQRRVVACDLLVLALHRGDGDVAFTGRCLLRRGRLDSTAASAVVTDSVHRDVIDDGLVVDIGDVRVTDIVH